MATEADPANQVQPHHQPIPNNLLEDLAERVFHIVQQRQQPRQLGNGGQAQEGTRDQSRPESGNQTQSTSSDWSESGGGDQLLSQGEQTGGPSSLAQAGHIKCTPALPPPPFPHTNLGKGVIQQRGEACHTHQPHRHMHTHTHTQTTTYPPNILPALGLGGSHLPYHTGGRYGSRWPSSASSTEQRRPITIGLKPSAADEVHNIQVAPLLQQLSRSMVSVLQYS